MKRFIIIFFIILILFILGLILFIHMNRDKITAGITTAIEKSTGKPLQTEGISKLSFFPMPGIELGKTTWGKPTEDLSISVTQCAFKISLFELLSGTIAINKIFLEDPIITFNNKKKAPSTPTKSTLNSQKNTTTDLPPITIESFIIKNGTILFSEDEKQITLKELNISASNIKPEEVGNIILSTQASIQPNNIVFSIKCKTSLIPSIEFINLKSFDIQVQPEKNLYATKPITISGSSQYLFNKNILEGLDLQIQLKNFITTAKGSINLNAANGTIAITANGSLKQLAQELGIVIVTPEKNALEKFSTTATAIINNGSIQVKNLNINVDETQITGNLDISLPKKFEGALSLTDINFDHYLPISIAEHGPITKSIQTAQQANASPNQSTSKKQLPSLNFTLKADTITIAKLRLQNFNSQITGNADEYQINPCNFAFYESQVSIKGTGKLAEQQPSYTGSIDSTDINLAALLNDLDVLSFIKQGSITLSATMYTSGINATQLKKNLNGTTQIKGKDITIHFEAIPKAVAELTNLGKQTFTQLDGNIQATNGTLSVNKFVLIGKPASASAKGVIVLPTDSIKLDADIGINDTVIPIHVYGDLLNPSYIIDPIRIIQGAVNVILNSEHKILNTILPKDTSKNINNAAEKIFNKIFGK